MSKLQIGLLIYVGLMIAAIAFVRGADARWEQRMKEIRRRKKLIRWPPGN